MPESIENRPDGPPLVHNSPGQAGPVEATFPERPPAARNRGQFVRGDPRINRQGRPRGSKAAPGDPADRAPRTDRLMLLVLDAAYIGRRLRWNFCPGVTNLPLDCQIVGGRLDAARAAAVFVIRSKEFPRVAKGAPIPEFQPEFQQDRGLANTARRAGPLTDLVIPVEVVRSWIRESEQQDRANWLDDFNIVGCRLERWYDDIRFTLYSPAFPVVAGGAAIPLLMWRGAR